MMVVYSDFNSKWVWLSGCGYHSQHAELNTLNKYIYIYIYIYIPPNLYVLVRIIGILPASK